MTEQVFADHRGAHRCVGAYWFTDIQGPCVVARTAAHLVKARETIRDMRIELEPLHRDLTVMCG